MMIDKSIRAAWLTLTMASSFLGAGPPASAAEPTSAEEIIAALKASTRAVETVRGTYRTYFAPGGEGSIAPDGPIPGMVAGPGNLVLYSEFDWAWQAAPYHEALDGRWGFADEGRFRYTHAAFGFDGLVLRGMSRDANGGLVKRLDETFRIWRGPLTLIGQGLAGPAPVEGQPAKALPTRNLVDLLQGARVVTLPGTPAGQTALRGTYQEPNQTLELTAWVDPARGFLPQKIEIFERERRFVTRRIVVDDLREVKPGVWLPLRGHETNYFIERFIFPDGITEEQVAKLPPDEIKAVVARAEAVAKPLGFGTQTYILDEASLRRACGSTSRSRATGSSWIIPRG